MITNNNIKEIKSLGQTKFRQKYNKFIAEGTKSTNQFLLSQAYTIADIFTTEDYYNIHTDLISPHQDKVSIIDRRTMKKISQLSNPSEILMVMEMSKKEVLLTHGRQDYSIYLDDVQDPGNVGTIIRLADWYGIKNVIRSEGSADFYNPKVVQATMGSMTGISLFTASHQELHNLDVPMYGTMMDGTPLNKIEWSPCGILVMGNEGRGISQKLLPYINQNIAIPGYKNRSAESLNVGIATGIISNEIFTKVLQK